MPEVFQNKQRRNSKHQASIPLRSPPEAVGVYTPAKGRPCTMEHSWSYSVLNEFQREHGLQKETPQTMSNHRKIQKAVRDRLLTMDLLPKDNCRAVWDQIYLRKDHRDLNRLIAHGILPVKA
ncbi:hypothetical protein Y1Q_0022801 [Alligator mississippiensis]|uniref:Uncharacterized protein n=1 Tax=Alligator mississippiensis TaxID=8496 RepID=A0A151N4T4_ALLMI|nr:hypothetical protein Y1Q_0022801 [Alligator mississippiensis]